MKENKHKYIWQFIRISLYPAKKQINEQIGIKKKFLTYCDFLKIKINKIMTKDINSV